MDGSHHLHQDAAGWVCCCDGWRYDARKPGGPDRQHQDHKTNSEAKEETT